MANRRALMIAVPAVAAAGFFFFPGSAPSGRNPLETSGVQNVGNAWSSGGGSTTHTPATASRRGDASSTAGSHEGNKGIGSPHFDEKLAAQKVGEPGKIEAAWRSTHLGNEKGK